MKIAIIIGATGMVGKQLLLQLLASHDYTEIKSLVRRTSGVEHPNLTEHIIDFDKPSEWKGIIIGDVLFSCLGTTIGQAKTKEEQYKVDYTYQYNAAKIASENKVATYVLVSSAGANARSSTFYMRMKGELDDAIQLLPFKTTIILRPGQLAGERTENRLGEKIGLSVMYGLNKLGLFKKFRPIMDCQVSRAMVVAAGNEMSEIYTLDELFKI